MRKAHEEKFANNPPQVKAIAEKPSVTPAGKSYIRTNRIAKHFGPAESKYAKRAKERGIVASVPVKTPRHGMFFPNPVGCVGIGRG